jgi:hypothetical protein
MSQEAPHAAIGNGHEAPPAKRSAVLFGLQAEWIYTNGIDDHHDPDLNYIGRNQCDPF